MTFALGKSSERNLLGVHPDLVKVVRRAVQLSEIDFIITEGLRTRSRQKALLASGATTTMNSRHLTGHAVDVAAIIGGKAYWKMPAYQKIADAFLQAAKELQIPIVWGGSWKSFKDGPHFELDRKTYP